MPNATPLPVDSPPPPPPRSSAPPLPWSFPLPPPPPKSVAKKTQEDVNVEVYENVFLKCMGAADRILGGGNSSTARNENQVKIASAIFDRFYNDQSAQKAGAVQAKAMIDAMTQVLEGRR
jgi:hypothetical protein